jgi:hypothetical protein
MIFKFFYAPFYNIRAITCQHDKLTRVKRQANIKTPCEATHASKPGFKIPLDTWFIPIVTPVRLSISRKDITSDADHA